MRFGRVSASMSACSNAWPTCSEPVTFGGGMTSENVGRSIAVGAAGGEDVGVEPALIGRRLYGARVVLRGQFDRIRGHDPGV